MLLTSGHQGAFNVFFWFHFCGVLTLIKFTVAIALSTSSHLRFVFFKVTELKSLANHVVVGSVSCEMLDLFCPLPQTLAVDINDLGTVKLNLEVTWRYLNPWHLSSPHYEKPNVQSALIYSVSNCLPCFFPISVHLIRMTRPHPPVLCPNVCCPTRAPLTRPPCGSRCFMWVNRTHRILGH